MSPSPNSLKLDFDKAKALWEAYQRTHDVSGLDGKEVGVDPDTEEIFFGDGFADIGGKLMAEGKFRPLAYFRVGRPTFWECGAGGRR